MENEIEPKEKNDPNAKAAANAASIDMDFDPDLKNEPDATDDLDEGELARFDNDGEKNYNTIQNSDAFKTAVENANKPQNP